MKPFGFLSSKQQIQTLGNMVLAGRLEKQGQKMVRNVGAWAVRTTDQIDHSTKLTLECEEVILN